VKLLLATTAAIVLFAGTAFAFGDLVVIAPPAKEKPDRGNGTDHPFPYDAGRLNQSPIRGKGAFKVVHNEPAPDESGAIHKALWLLQDNSYRCFKPSRP
jgi:hypothetical protein